MKKNLLNKLWLRVGMIVAIMTTALSGTTWAETSIVTSSKVTSSSVSWTGSASETWSVIVTGGATNQNVTSGYAQVGTKNSPSTSITLSTSGISGTITSVVLDCASYSGLATVSCTVGGSSFGEQTQSSPSWSNNNGGNVTFNGSASGAIVITMTNGSGGRAMYIKSITVTYTPGGATQTVATPSFSVAEGTYTSAQTVAISCATSGATIYYTTDGNTPTTSSSVYSSALTISETTTVKAMAVKEGMNNSAVASATYTIVSLDHAGTAADPYTVADARTAIDANVGKTGVYATGIVSEIVTAYNSGYGNITFDIIDEGGSNTLRAYRCGGSEAANVQVGDIVVVSGNLTLFGSTYEFEQGCTLISRIGSNPQVAAGLSFSSNSAAADLADLSSFTAPTFSNPNNLSVTFSSSNTTVASVAQDGTVTPLAKGTTIITATSEETTEYLAGEASYTLTVTNSNTVLVTVDADGNTIFDFTENGWGFPTDYQVEEGSFSNSGYTIKVAGSSSNGFKFMDSGTLILGKSGAYLTLPAFDYAVNKIDVIGSSSASASVTQNIYVGETAVSTATTGARDVTNTYEITGNYQAAGTIYTLKVTNGNNTQVTGIIVYKAPVHTVSFSVNGVISSSVEQAEGTSIAFPANPEDINGKTFVGWTTTEIAGTTDTEPAMVTSATMGNTDVTYYAVFATLESAGTSTIVTDVLTTATFGSPSSYTSWSNKQAENGSSAVYAGETTTNSNTNIQMRATNPSGIITTTSGGTVKKVSVKWASNTASGRILEIFGSNTAYTSSSQLYNAANWGTPLGEITCDTNTELTINGDYAYVGIKSKENALYLEKITIEWETGTPDTYSAYCTTIPVAPTSQTVTVSAVGYATFVANADLEIPSGVEVFAVKVNDGAASAHLNPITDGIPAGEAVLVRASADTYEFPYTAETVAEITNNDLKASTVAFNPTAENTIYCLANKTKGIGFYPVATSVLIPVGKAYLDLSAVGGVKAFYGFEEDDPTGISNLNANVNANEGAIYNLSGQMVNGKLPKGIYIVNGKKILK